MVTAKASQYERLKKSVQTSKVNGTFLKNTSCPVCNEFGTKH